MNVFQKLLFTLFVHRKCEICGEKRFELNEVGELLVCDDYNCIKEAQEIHEKLMDRFLDRRPKEI